MLEVVALTEDVPDRGLLRGRVGTVVEVPGDDAVEVEFVDDSGRTYAECALSVDRLMVLHYRPSRVA